MHLLANYYFENSALGHSHFRLVGQTSGLHSKEYRFEQPELYDCRSFRERLSKPGRPSVTIYLEAKRHLVAIDEQRSVATCNPEL